jgi:uncharacterized repeat protein (TIGR01451 family)
VSKNIAFNPNSIKNFVIMILCVSIVSVVLLPAFAQPQNIINVTVNPDNSSKKSGETVKFTIVITNMGKTQATINEIYVNKILVNNNLGMFLPSNSSDTTTYDFPVSMEPGTYTIPFMVKDQNQNSGVAMAELTVTGDVPKITSFGIALDSILLLLAAFLIPAQIIERFMVLINKLHCGTQGHKKDVFFETEKINSLTKMKEKIIEVMIKNLSSSSAFVFLDNIKKEMTRVMLKEIQGTHNVEGMLSELKINTEDIDNLLNEEFVLNKIKNFLEKKQVKEYVTKINTLEEKFKKMEEEFDKFVKAQYNSSNGQPPKDIEEKIKKFKESKNLQFEEEYERYFEEIDKMISTSNDNKADHESIHEIRIWILACGFGLAPAIPLSIMGIGLLQFLGLTSPVVILMDAIVGALFIGSGTKPIHDIIEWIQKIRKT